MKDQKRITDHEPIIAAAREDAATQAARIVHMTVGELWRLIHRAPTLTTIERENFALALKTR